MFFTPALTNLLLATLSLAVALPASVLDKRSTQCGVSTYYDQLGAAGSCGIYHSDSDIIVALGNAWMDNEYQSPYCSRYIELTNEGGGSSNYGVGNVVIAKVQDTCQACDENHVDLSEGTWNSLSSNTPLSVGTFNICWHFCDADYATTGVC